LISLASFGNEEGEKWSHVEAPQNRSRVAPLPLIGDRDREREKAA